MKLIAKATSYFFIIYVSVMIIGAVFLYSSIRSLLYRQMDESLFTEKKIIQEQIELTDTIPDFAEQSKHQIEVRLLDVITRYSEKIKDTTIYDPNSGSEGNFRYLLSTGNTNKGHGYVIRVLQPLDENEDLLKDISLYLSFLFVGILIASVLINYIVSKRLWNPFYLAVSAANNFNVQTDQPLMLPETDTDEFRKLNSVIADLTERIKRDYNNLKEFNEDASHEIQTPIAIIRSKAEILMQSPGLTMDDLEKLKSVTDAAGRLQKLNQGLLLISKIENGMFGNDKKLSLRRIFENYLENYREIIKMKNISTISEGPGSGMVKMDETLADILVSNLVSNSVRYNTDNGFIRIYTSNGEISISNPGPEPGIATDQLFKRFRKGSRNAQSVGLGLSIVRKITENYAMTARYIYEKNVHQVIIEFPVAEKDQQS